jgi:hypothetical protein
MEVFSRMVTRRLHLATCVEMNTQSDERRVMRDQNAVNPQPKRTRGATRTRLGIGFALAMVAAATVSGVGTASAQAMSSSPTTALRCDHPCSKPPPGGGWSYIDNYFWASSCIDAGNRGINSGLWARYECYGSATTNYDLWVHK